MGHLPPMIGRIMENDVKRLLELMGYSIIRENVIFPSIDKVVKHIGEPKPIPKYPCYLLPPIYSPEGNIAISIKKSSFNGSDVTELIDHIDEARNSDDEILAGIDNGLIISNSLKSPSEINAINVRDIYCWDLTRIFFYASKSRKAKILSRKAAIRECRINIDDKYTYLRHWTSSDKNNSIMDVDISIFVDIYDNEFIYSTDHNRDILTSIYNNEIYPMIDERDINTNVKFEIHVLGKAAPDLVRKDYIDFAQEYVKTNEREVGSTFEASLPIHQYSVSPWSVLIN